MTRRIYRLYSSIVLTVCTIGVILVGIGIIALAHKEPPVVVVIEDNAQDFDVEEEVTAEETEQFDPATVDALARLVWGEARGCSKTEQAAVIWCVLNRVDSELAYFPNTVMEVLTQKNAFSGYSNGNPVLVEHYDLVLDVLTRWADEKNGCDDVGRVLPKDYLYFRGDGRHNYFRREYAGGNEWDFAVDSPYT